jgi:hypothetical protein
MLIKNIFVYYIMFIVFIVLVILILFSARKIEKYGVFSHRGTLHGIKNRVRSHYTLPELNYQNPFNYWTTGKNLSIYDKDIQKYHSKRFDPSDIQ